MKDSHRRHGTIRTPALVSRRNFFSITALSAVGLGPACNATSLGDDADAGASKTSRHFPQSVASGDPRTDSVVLWTRIIDEDVQGPLDVRLELALDEDFERLVEVSSGGLLTAEPAADFCIRVRVDKLDPATIYYYRFVYQTGSAPIRSRTGRTKTAPLPDSEVPIRFAVTSCQDYSQRYYHAFRHLAGMDLDFLVHLGDYIYETAEDPRFQDGDGVRRIVFDDTEGALGVSQGGGLGLTPEDEPTDASPVMLAARSLDNYRQLYRTVRSDPDLQALHERCPIIAVWDDHEFTNDAHGETATYTDGRTDERDAERRKNADQAWVEYMPIDFPEGPNFEYDRDAPFPDNLRIYRDFVFGRTLHLVMTDLRRYRSDHLVPEDAFPAAIALDQGRLEALLGEVPERAVAYVDIDSMPEHREELANAMAEGELDGREEDISGNLDAAYVNTALDQLNSSLARLDLESELDRGLPYSALGKTEPHASVGARYFVDYEVYGWLAKARYEDTGGASEDLMGREQAAWFTEVLQSSTSHWKVWGNEFAFMEQRGDLRTLPVPENLRRELLISVDDWNGAPNERTALLEQLQEVDNLVVLTGDLHSFFAGTTGTPFGDRTIEFMCGAATSATYRAILEQTGLTIPGLSDLGLAAGLLLQRANPHMAYQELNSNGVATVVVTPERMDVTFHLIPLEDIQSPELDGKLEDHFTQEQFRVRRDTAILQRKIDGEFRSWNAETQQWE